MPEAPLPELPVALAARYRPLGGLGAGAMGVVLEALEPALNRTVVLKLIRELLDDDVGRIRERWWRWRTAAPDDPRLSPFDEQLHGLPVR